MKLVEIVCLYLKDAVFTYYIQYTNYIYLVVHVRAVLLTMSYDFANRATQFLHEVLAFLPIVSLLLGAACSRMGNSKNEDLLLNLRTLVNRRFDDTNGRIQTFQSELTEELHSLREEFQTIVQKYEELEGKIDILEKRYDYQKYQVQSLSEAVENQANMSIAKCFKLGIGAEITTQDQLAAMVIDKCETGALFMT